MELRRSQLLGEVGLASLQAPPTCWGCRHCRIQQPRGPYNNNRNGLYDDKGELSCGESMLIGQMWTGGAQATKA